VLSGYARVRFGIMEGVGHVGRVGHSLRGTKNIFLVVVKKLISVGYGKYPSRPSRPTGAGIFALTEARKRPIVAQPNSGSRH
jgi:hypothetical protein